jgi:V8-like Glu-specific endopeptidase
VIFNNKFGVKRLAPGTVKAGPGEIEEDSKSWICAHDASTLGGNSGSCVADLSEDGFRITGLHFAGINREQNWAHVAARLHQQLSLFSAKFVS